MGKNIKRNRDMLSVYTVELITSLVMLGVAIYFINTFSLMEDTLLFKIRSEFVEYYDFSVRIRYESWFIIYSFFFTWVIFSFVASPETKELEEFMNEKSSLTFKQKFQTGTKFGVKLSFSMFISILAAALLTAVILPDFLKQAIIQLVDLLVSTCAGFFVIIFALKGLHFTIDK